MQKKAKTKRITDKDIENAYRVARFSYPDDDDAIAETNNLDNVEGPLDAFTNFNEPRKLGLGFCDRLCDNFIDESKKMKYQDLLNSIKEHR